MNPHNELKAEMEAIQQQIGEAKKSDHGNALSEVDCLWRAFGFTAGVLKGGVAKGLSEK